MESTRWVRIPPGQVLLVSVFVSELGEFLFLSEPSHVLLEKG
ncbi:hypothetical protein ACWGCI_10780 [Streptomyces sp. NPDC054949]